MKLALALVVAVVSCFIGSISGRCTTSQFYMLKANKERMEADCTVLWSGTKTVTRCLNKACRLGGNVINHRASFCQVLQCPTSGPIPMVTSVGADIYALETEFPCTLAKEKMMSCWTCLAKKSAVECLLKGRMEVCMQPDAICEFQVLKKGITPFITIVSYDRKCVARTSCSRQELRPQGYTQNLMGIFSRKTKCAYGDGMSNHHCIDVSQGSHTLDTSFYRGFYQFWRQSAYTMSSCPRLGISCGFTPESCWKLSTVMGGNAINYRKMPLGECDVRVCGTLDLQPIASPYATQVFVHANPFPCDFSMARNLSCWTCLETNDFNCWKNGGMVACTMQDPVCGYEKLSMDDNTVYSVRRRCEDRAPCHAKEFEPAPGECQVTVSPPGKKCTQCMYEVPGITYGCHEPWNEECMDQFTDCVTLGTKCGQCEQLGVAGSHWEASCFNFACRLGGNVAYFREANRTCKVERCPCFPLILDEPEGWKVYAKDTDECRMDLDDCGENAECENLVPVNCTDPGFDCGCVPGFEGDGHNCTNVNECDEEPCGTNCLCVDTEGSFMCTVPDGFTGDGYTVCEDCDECDPTSSCPNDCHADAECTNTIGSFTCDCLDGFTGDGRQCSPASCDCKVIGDPLVHGFDDVRMPLLGPLQFLVTSIEHVPGATYQCDINVYVTTSPWTAASVPGINYVSQVMIDVNKNGSPQPPFSIIITETGVMTKFDTDAAYTTLNTLPTHFAGTTTKIQQNMDNSIVVIDKFGKCNFMVQAHLTTQSRTNWVKIRTTRDYILRAMCGNCDGQMNDLRDTTGADLSTYSDVYMRMSSAWAGL